MANKAPVKEIRMGALKALVWENDTKNGIRHNVTVARIWKTEDGEWKESQSFGRDDLPALKQVIDDAWKWIYASNQAPIRTCPRISPTSRSVVDERWRKCLVQKKYP